MPFNKIKGHTSNQKYILCMKTSKGMYERIFDYISYFLYSSIPNRKQRKGRAAWHRQAQQHLYNNNNTLNRLAAIFSQFRISRNFHRMLIWSCFALNIVACSSRSPKSEIALRFSNRVRNNFNKRWSHFIYLQNHLRGTISTRLNYLGHCLQQA